MRQWDEGAIESMHEGMHEGMHEVMNVGIHEVMNEGMHEAMSEGMNEGMLRTMEMPSDDLGKIHGSTCADAQPSINAISLRSAEARVEVSAKTEPKEQPKEQHLPRIAVFASGSGSNFQAIVDAAACGQRLKADIALLVCDKPQARVIERAKQAGVQTAIFEPKKYASREEYEQDVLRLLHKQRVDLVVLAGYMRLVTPVLLRAYEGRMVNIHPSLLPAFPGMHAVRQALDYGVKVTGVTVHLVDEGMDTGPILAQQVVAILPNDTEDTLSARIQQAEHELYPQVVQNLLSAELLATS